MYSRTELPNTIDALEPGLLIEKSIFYCVSSQKFPYSAVHRLLRGARCSLPVVAGKPFSLGTGLANFV